MLDYRPRLRLAAIAGTDVGSALRRLALAIEYFFRSVTLLVPGLRRAKSPLAKAQLGIGFGMVGVLLASVVFTALAVLASVGVWNPPDVHGNAVNAVALGATAFTMWLLFKVRPAVQQAATLVAQLLDYAQDERHAAGVAGGLDTALDDLLEDRPDRNIHLFGYSLGALVAMDYLYPRKSLHPQLDERHKKAISTLVTVGCPVDFIQLYWPRYRANRRVRVPGLRWTNVYIAADVLGSSFGEGDDCKALRTGQGSGRQADPDAMPQPDPIRYTDERLKFWNIWSARGFLSHGGYWDEPDHENCMHLVIPNEVWPAASQGSKLQQTRGEASSRSD